MNPNNCQLCDHMHNRMHPRDDGLHCYMFKDEPTKVCYCHTLRTHMTVNEVIDGMYSDIRRHVATQDRKDSLRAHEGSNAK